MMTLGRLPDAYKAMTKLKINFDFLKFDLKYRLRLQENSVEEDIEKN